MTTMQVLPRRLVPGAAPVSVLRAASSRRVSGPPTSVSKVARVLRPTPGSEARKAASLGSPSCAGSAWVRAAQRSPSLRSAWWNSRLARRSRAVRDRRCRTVASVAPGGHPDGGLAKDAERCCGIDPADAVLLEQARHCRLAQARCLGRGRRHGPQRKHPLGRAIIGQFEQLRVVAPKLLADAVAQAHALLLKLLGQARPLAQLDDGGVASLHGPEQLRVGAQPRSCDPRVAAVVWRRRR